MADPPSQKIRQRSTVGPLGCLIQVVGLVLAAIAVPLFVSPFGPLGLLAPVLILVTGWRYGINRERRFECAQCGEPLPSKHAPQCPACHAALTTGSSPASPATKS